MKKHYLKYFTALLLFGTNGIIASQIHLESYYIVLLRTMIGSIFLLLIYLIAGYKFTFFKHRKDLLFILLSGIAMGSSWMLLYEAYVQIGVSISTLLYYCGPIIVILLSPFLFREKLTFYKILGFFIVLCGIFLLNGKMDSTLNTEGLLYALLSALCYSVMVITNKKDCANAQSPRASGIAQQ